MTTKALQVGIAGYGYWGPNLVRNFAEAAGAAVAWICDRDGTRLEKARARWPGVRLTQDYGEMLADASLDAVAVATPVSTHFDLARRALEAGKHVFVEKPLTDSSETAAKLVALAKEKGRVLAVDHTFVYTGAVRKMKELVDSGEMGELRYYDSVRINLGLFQHDVNVLWDLAPHDFSILAHLVRETPSEIQTAGVAHVGSMVNTAYVTAFYPSGFLAHCHVNWLSPVKIRQIILGGSKRMAVYDDMQTSEKLKIYDCGVEAKTRDDVRRQLVEYRVGDMHAPRIPSDEALGLEVRHFLRCLHGEEKPMTGGESGLLVVRMLEAAQKSLDAGGARVRL